MLLQVRNTPNVLHAVLDWLATGELTKGELATGELTKGELTKGELAAGGLVVATAL